MRADTRPYALAFACGLAACLAVSLVSGRREAWDSSLYFVAAIPAMCVAAFWLGYRHPVRAWRWALAMALGQSVAMLFAGNSPTLWPLSLVAMTVLSLPQLVLALLGGRMGRATPVENDPPRSTRG